MRKIMSSTVEKQLYNLSQWIDTILWSEPSFNSINTQMCAFHLHNRESNRQHSITWSSVTLEKLYLAVPCARLFLALCYSTAEYACPVWVRSPHAKKVDPAINATCRLVTGCLKPTPIDKLYILSGIAPLEIWWCRAAAKYKRMVSPDNRPM